MDDNSSNSPGILDSTAVALSGLCLLHCLTLPLLIAVLPFVGQFAQGHFHMQMLLVVLPVSIIAFSLGFRRHHTIGIVASGFAGMLLLVLGATVVHDSYGVAADRAVTISAALILATAHYFNNRYSRHRVLKT